MTVTLKYLKRNFATNSPIQKPTKFHAPHCRRSGSTGFRSWLMSISWALVKPGSLSTASLSAMRLPLATLKLSMMADNLVGVRLKVRDKVEDEVVAAV